MENTKSKRIVDAKLSFGKKKSTIFFSLRSDETW